MRKTTRKATDYLSAGDWVRVPDSIPAPILYSAETPNGATVREGQIEERFVTGGVSVRFGSKTWDYSNREALQFSRIHPF